MRLRGGDYKGQPERSDTSYKEGRLAEGVELSMLMEHFRPEDCR